MKVKQIQATSLPQIPGIAKDLVNYGRWFLYEVSIDSIHEARYLLSTNNNDFLLHADGQIISPLPREMQVNYIAQITFSDIPMPHTKNFIEL